MFASNRTTVSIVGAIALSALLLTGCASGAGSSGSSSSGSTPKADSQTKTQACAQLGDGIASLGTEFSDSAANLATDPDAAVAAMTKIADAFAANAKKVTNSTVTPTATKANKALAGITAEFTKYAADPATADTAALSASATDLQEAFTKLQELCG